MRHLAAYACAGLVAVLSLAAAAPAFADLQLLMLKREGCLYCRQWDREIGPIYAKTEEGRLAPLLSLDIGAPLPENARIARPPNFTPTFILLQEGVEVGRIEGYPGEAFFWGLLDGLISETQSE